MAHSIVILVTDLRPADDAGDDLLVAGTARLSTMSPSADSVPWSVQFDPTQLAATINEAIKDAAIAAAEAEPYNFDVGLLDKKTLIGGAIGL